MVYIGADGNVVEKRSRWRISIITDIITGITNFISLFFSAMTTPPDRINDGNRSTYTQRQGVRRPTQGGGGTRLGGASQRANIRRVKDLGSVDAACGGGG